VQAVSGIVLLATTPTGRRDPMRFDPITEFLRIPNYKRPPYDPRSYIKGVHATFSEHMSKAFQKYLEWTLSNARLKLNACVEDIDYKSHRGWISPYVESHLL
jgi:hypothetical protein